jgi:NifB/MoaA-like Fe-S oxidoreductase
VLRDGFERSVEWGDRATLGILAFGAVRLVDIRQPELALVIAVAMSEVSSPLGGETLEATQRAVGRARDEIGNERADVLTARIEAMIYDEIVEHFGAELDRALASAV